VDEAEGEIHYKAVSARECLVEINNIIELMIDLAYSAVLFHDLELAEEVIEFDKQVDYLRTLLLMNVAMAVGDHEDAEAMTGIVRVATAADRISGAAREIARTVLLELSVGEDIIGALSGAVERLVRTKIAPESILSGKTLQKLKLGTKIGVDIMTIRRGKQLTINPKGSNTLETGDMIIVRGSHVGTSEFDKLAKAELKMIPEPGMK